MDIISDFLNWAWARHHNILSWYIRPLFLLPYCYFAYKRSIIGLVLTVIALATSMFWFPEPDYVDPKVTEFLNMEKDYLLGTWTMSKILMSLLIPVLFTALTIAFWKRSWIYGIVVINLMAVLKILWSIYFGGSSGLFILAPAVAGLVICNAIIIIAVKFISRRKL